ncbi:unnamed protein product [Absidia cylindrospora]
MPSKPSIFINLLSTLKKKTRRPHATDHTNHSTGAPQAQLHMIDSAFSTSSTTEAKWEDELERVHQYGQQLSDNWYEALEQLTLVVDKVTSPFLNTNRISLHLAQLFIESYRDDWGNRHSGKNTYKEKIQQADHRFSDHFDLKQCAMGICELEKDLFNYRQTMDQQLTSLWNSRQADQLMDSWKDYLQQYHHELNQMEKKFKALLDTSSPNPDEYTCAVCLSIFTDPITLHPCLHTFCKDCVQHIYCTCQLTQCVSSCHDATNRSTNIHDDDDDSDLPNNNQHRKRGTKAKRISQRLSSAYKPRYRSMTPLKTPSPTPPSPPRQRSFLRAPLKIHKQHIHAIELWISH